MSLNIKDEATHRLIRELARLTGVSMTAAVNDAVRERLEHVRRNSRQGIAERLKKIGQECAAHLQEPYKSTDIDKLLYDDKGLWK